MISKIIESMRQTKQKIYSMDQIKAQRRAQLMRLKQEVRDGVQGHDAYVIQNGRAVKINRNTLSKSAAQGIARYNVDNTSATEYRVVENGRKAGIVHPQNMLRFALRGKFTGNIEKPQYRRDTYGEMTNRTAEEQRERISNMRRRLI